MRTVRPKRQPTAGFVQHSASLLQLVLHGRAGGCLAERRAAGLIDTVRLWVTAMRDDISPRRE